MILGAMSDGAERDGRSVDGRLSQVVVRLKRRLVDQADAPKVLVLPQKRSRVDDELRNDFSKLRVNRLHKDDLPNESVSDSSGIGERTIGAGEPKDERVALVCELVDTDGSIEKQNGDPDSVRNTTKRRFEGTTEDYNIKKSKVVHLELSHGSVTRGKLPCQSREGTREIDAAILEMMQSGYTARLKDFLREHPTETVNFQRPSDGTTALMAAAAHCNLDMLNYLFEKDADFSIEDSKGFKARDYLGLCLDKPSLELLEQATTIIDRNKFVFDTYVIKESVPVTSLRDARTKHGPMSLWTDAPPVDFELDLDDPDIVTGPVFDFQAPESVDESDLENSNDENYRYNEYPDEDELESWLESSDSSVASFYSDKI